MLRVTTLYASSAVATAAYYTRYLAQAPGEEPGVWSGQQAADLGLDGHVDADALQSLLEGRDPQTSGGDSRCTFWTRFGGHPAAYRALPSMYSVAERDAIPHAGADRPDRGGGSSRRRRTVAMRQAHP